MMYGLHFLRPDAFLLLLPIVPIVVFLWWSYMKLEQRARRAYGEERLISRFSEPLRRLGHGLVLSAWLGSMALLVAALAGPVLPDAPVRVTEGSLQVVNVIDVSTSMAAEDYRPFMPRKNGIEPNAVPGRYGTRLDMVKVVIGDHIMPAVAGNEIGIVTFMGEGWNLVDLTNDYTYIRDSMRVTLKIGNAPGGGSDYAEGLREALVLFEQTPAPNKQKVIVLFSDGGFTGKQEVLNEMLEKVQKANIRVIIVGIGGDEPKEIPVYEPSTGQQIGNEQRKGKTVTTQIDEAALTALRDRIDGAEYVRLVPGQDLKVNWASKLAPSDRTESHETEVYTYPLGAAMVLVFVLFLRGIMPARRRRSN
jgi:hypothetical protein